MNSRALKVPDIIESLRDLADPKRLEMSKTYYPTSMEVIGVTVPDVRSIIKFLNPDIKLLSHEYTIRFCLELIDANIFECQQIAYELAGRNKKLMEKISGDDIRKMDKNQDNWVSVDTYSALILGVGWRLGRIYDQEIIARVKSENFWIRRQALVATLGWNQKSRGGTGNSLKTIMICEMFIDDHHDMINKALSWALRELTRTDRQSVIQFLESHDKRLSARVKREVWNKLETGLKNKIR